MKNSKTPQLDWIVKTPVESMMRMITRGNEGDYARSVHAEQASDGKRNWQVGAIVCADGTTLSVQASEHMYCSPRSNEGNYTEVEVGFPSVEVGLAWQSYKDGPAEQADQSSVFAYVPVELVREFILAHGGEQLPN